MRSETFTRYSRSVPILFPSTRPYPDRGNERWSFGQMIRNQEPFVMLGLLVAFAFLAWKLGA